MKGVMYESTSCGEMAFYNWTFVVAINNPKSKTKVVFLISVNTIRASAEPVNGQMR